MPTRRVRRGRARRDELREQGETRNAEYAALSLEAKIKRQIAGGHNGQQLRKLQGHEAQTKQYLNHARGD